MVFGHNTNVKIGAVTYHVQTEDRGEAHALIDTTVYYQGRVLHRRTNNYFDLLPANEDRKQALKLRVDEQHHTVLEEMQSGSLQLAIPQPTVHLDDKTVDAAGSARPSSRARRAAAGSGWRGRTTKTADRTDKRQVMACRETRYAANFCQRKKTGRRFQTRILPSISTAPPSIRRIAVGPGLMARHKSILRCRRLPAQTPRWSFAQRKAWQPGSCGLHFAQNPKYPQLRDRSFVDGPWKMQS